MEALRRGIKRVLDVVGRYAETERQPLNFEKIKVMPPTRGKKSTDKLREGLRGIALENVEMQIVDDIKILGIKFDSRRTYEKHFEEVMVKPARVARDMLVVAGQSWGPGIQEMGALYSALAESLVRYGLGIWGRRLNVGRYGQLQVALSKCSRFALGVPSAMSTRVLYEIAGKQTLWELQMSCEQLLWVRSMYQAETNFGKFVESCWGNNGAPAGKDLSDKAAEERLRECFPAKVFRIERAPGKIDTSCACKVNIIEGTVETEEDFTTIARSYRICMATDSSFMPDTGLRKEGIEVGTGGSAVVLRDARVGGGEAIKAWGKGTGTVTSSYVPEVQAIGMAAQLPEHEGMVFDEVCAEDGTQGVPKKTAIFSDSLSALERMRTWKPNTEDEAVMMTSILQLARRTGIDIYHVRGHAKISANEVADKTANRARRTACLDWARQRVKVEIRLEEEEEQGPGEKIPVGRGKGAELREKVGLTPLAAKKSVRKLCHEERRPHLEGTEYLRLNPQCQNFMNNCRGYRRSLYRLYAQALSQEDWTLLHSYGGLKGKKVDTSEGMEKCAFCGCLGKRSLTIAHALKECIALEGLTVKTFGYTATLQEMLGNPRGMRIFLADVCSGIWKDEAWRYTAVEPAYTGDEDEPIGAY